ncbi:hypothetical protein [Paenibacillus agricola]|uniref:Uncharacterized protein n=1 Tax=Paenibacillus agricola TaxID=2716264 RepID=A0ABX0J2P6_9BACL|nr:hypothetical protein [Paenibacillus agricola]NHN29695.1 hypothetical protein [Paenibacillus agricola]
MIIIVLLYGCIICYEWRYLKLRNRKRLTFQYVLGTAILLFVCMEALYVFREQWTIAETIQTIFDPIDKTIRGKK